jgi:PPP family 3-phenylpropionic acid transporter
MTDGKDYTGAFRRYQFLSFTMLGIINALLTRFFQAQGLTRAQIGTVQTPHWLVAAVMPFLWGMASDGSRDRRLPLLAAIVGACVSFFGFLWCTTVWEFMVVTVIFAGLFRGITPMGIALTFSWAEKKGRDYSRIRMFGTAGYVASLVLLTFVLKGRPLNTIFPVFIVFAVAAVVGLLMLPKIPGEHKVRFDWHAIRLLGRPAFAMTLVCTFLAQAAIATHYTFFSPFISKELGVADAYIPLFFAFGSVIEFLMLTQMGKLIARFGTKWMLTLGMLGIAVRLATYAAFPYVAVVFLVQGLHAFTFAAVHSSTVTFVNYTAPPKWRSSAQTIFEGFTIGLGMAAGTFIGGYVSQAKGYYFLFGSAAAVAALAMLVYAAFGRSVSLVRQIDEVGEESPLQE